MDTENLEEYIDNKSYQGYKKIFYNTDELNRILICDFLKKNLNYAISKTVKDYMIVRISRVLYNFNSIVTRYQNFEYDNSIDHLMYMLKRQIICLKKLSILLSKTEDIDDLRNIYLNANAMINLSQTSIAYYNDLITQIISMDSNISFISNRSYNIALYENKMDSIQSNVKKLLK